jgi:hypothetical protein
MITARATITCPSSHATPWQPSSPRHSACARAPSRRERAEPVRVEADPERLQVVHALGRFAHEDLRRRTPDEFAPGDLGVAEMQLEAVIGRERCREPSLRPVARRLRERGGGHEHDARSPARRAEGCVEAGGARAHHGDVGLLQGRRR